MSNGVDLSGSKVQIGWASCPKCQGMHFAGFPDFKGVCPAGGPHEETNSFAYTMAFDAPVGDHVQTGFASCPRCQGMHFAGFAGNKGVCPAGGQHDETNSFAYAMIHDVPPTDTLQVEFRSCPRCQGVFFGPFKGRCPAGGEHSQDGSFNYAMQVEPPMSADTHAFDSGPLTSGLPLGGSVHVIMRQNGDFTFSSHAHDSGFDNVDYVVSAVVMTPAGIAYTFQHSGHTEGTIAGLPFGTPNRDDDFVSGGTNPSITSEFGGIHHGSRLVASIDGKDTLVQGIEGVLGDLIKKAGDELGKAAAGAIIALVV